MRWGYPWRIWLLRLTSNAAGAHAEPLPLGAGRSVFGVGRAAWRDGTPLFQILYTTARKNRTIRERPAALG